MPHLADRLLVLPQYLLPQHALSRLVKRLTRIETPFVKDLLMRVFLQCYAVDLDEAAQANPRDYASFNAFFTRALRAGARPLAGGDNALVSPADGTISQLGALDGDTLLQAKGKSYTLMGLLAGDTDLAALFVHGSFATIYLAPFNYHRVHSPLAGEIERVIYVPGRLFSVNQRTSRVIPDLFARNERVVVVLRTAYGRVAVILVGAMLVGSMELIGCDLDAALDRQRRREPFAVNVGQRPPRLARGAELGRFNMGSTVILLCERGRTAWHPEWAPGALIRVGQELGSCTDAE